MRTPSGFISSPGILNCGIALILVLLLAIGPPMAASEGQSPNAQAAIPAEQLDSLVAPVALYPDPLLSQVLVASTYPLELVQLQQWLDKNKGLTGKPLTDAVMKQDWDPSVEAMAPLPDLVKQLTDNIKWTTELGNAFLAQQADVMDSVQRMRKKASDKGTLKSSEQQRIETKTVESKQVIVIEPASPEVVYVPSYNPTVVYGAPPPAYAYPPIAYPPPGYYAAGMAMSFGMGVAVGAAWSGGWGYNCNWHGGNNNITINNNNTYINNSNLKNVQAGNRSASGNTWQHNPEHRGGTPYADRTTASKYGGTTRTDSMGSRQNAARQQQTGAANRGEGFTSGNRSAAADNMAGANRGAATERGGDRAGNQMTSRGSSGSGAFGASGNGASARASSSRGAASSGRSGGGGRRR